MHIPVAALVFVLGPVTCVQPVYAFVGVTDGVHVHLFFCVVL